MEVLNVECLRETELLFRKYGISLPKEGVEIYSNVFEICSRFVEEKLSTEEILRTYDLLSDVMKGDRPDIAANVPKEDRIRIAMRLMEELDDTKGKLTSEEKAAFAFCILTGECTQVLDEKDGIIKNGIVLFDSFEHIEELLADEKNSRPSRFAVNTCPVPKPDSDYGFSVEKAIRTTSIGASYRYLDRLCYNGNAVHYDRIGSFSNSAGEIVDGYDLYTVKAGFVPKKTLVGRIFINAYCDEPLEIAPKGFTLDV